MSDLTDIYTAEPRLGRHRVTRGGVARRDGVVPWEAVRTLLDVLRRRPPRRRGRRTATRRRCKQRCRGFVTSR